MELKIYNKQLELVDTVDTFKSLIWSRKYNDVGTFELHLPLSKDNVLIFAPENIIFKKIGANNEAGIIEDISLVDSKTKTLIVKGRFLTSYLSRRLIKNTFYFNGNAEIAIRNLINYCVPISLLELAEIQYFDENINFQATMKNLLSIIQKIAKTSDFGLYLKPDFTNKKLIFTIYKGIDRSINQNINNRVIFSDSFQNLNKIEYKFNSQLYANYAVIGGEGEGSERIYTNLDNSIANDIREIFVDAKDIKKDTMTDEEYTTVLLQKGTEILNANQINISYDFEVRANSTFQYLKDYDLGDIVTIKNSTWNIQQDLRIVQVEEVYEKGGLSISLTLGNPLKTAVDWSN